MTGRIFSGQASLVMFSFLERLWVGWFTTTATRKAAGGSATHTMARSLADITTTRCTVLSPGGRPIDESPLSSSKTSNWVARKGGLPPYVRGIARGVAKKHGGKVTSRDIAIAISAAKRFEKSKHPAIAAAAAKANARWEVMKNA